MLIKMNEVQSGTAEYKTFLVRVEKVSSILGSAPASYLRRSQVRDVCVAASSASRLAVFSFEAWTHIRVEVCQWGGYLKINRYKGRRDSPCARRGRVEYDQYLGLRGGLPGH